MQINTTIVTITTAILISGCPETIDLNSFSDRKDGKTAGEDSDESIADHSPMDELPNGELLSETDLELLPIDCTEYERNEEFYCISISAGNMAVRFETTIPSQCGIVCMDNEKEKELAPVFESTKERLHHLTMRDLKEGVNLSCRIQCSSPTEGKSAISFNFDFKTLQDYGLRITEVYENPAGAEPQQEFVEVMNLTAYSLSLEGWMISDSYPAECIGDGFNEQCSKMAIENSDILPPEPMVQPFSKFLIVASGFSTATNEDAPVEPNCPIIRVDGSIGNRGLKNSGGEPVFLLTPEGRVASFFPNPFGKTIEGVSCERVNLDHPDGDPLNWIQNQENSSSPCR